MIVPKNDDHSPILKARPGSPFNVIGYPSNVVATEEGVPGIPSNIDVIRPPLAPPAHTPIINEIPANGSIAKLNGSVRATAIVIVKPGMLPKIIPAITPTIIKNIIFNDIISDKLVKKFSKKLPPYVKIKNCSAKIRSSSFQI